MVKGLLRALKIIIPVGLGIFLSVYVYNQLEEDQKQEVFHAVAIADYFWIGVSVVIGIISHLSRAYRWQFLLEPMGLRPRFANSFFAVMIGYFMNLLLPRVGEISRCGVLRRYEKMPIDKLFGTVVAERIADLLILGAIFGTIILSEYRLIAQAIGQLKSDGDDPTDNASFPILWILLASIAVLIALFLLLRKRPMVQRFMAKIRELAYGFKEGLTSIIKMKKRVAFVFHTLLIWASYVLMFFVCFECLPQTQDVGFMGRLVAFVVGGISIILVQGGIGIYPTAVMVALTLYGVGESHGYALGWIIWIAQTMMILVLGVIAMVGVSVYNRSKKS